MKRLILAVLFLASSFPLSAQFMPDPQYERVLIPVFFFGGGAYGAQWWTDVQIISTEGDVELANEVLVGFQVCPALCGCGPEKRIDAWTVESVCPHFEHPAGLLLYVPRTARDWLQIASRGGDLSRRADRYGTQIPVVWEDDLFDSTMMLLDIPTDPRYRASLRLYDAFQWETGFTLRFHDMAKLRDGNAIPIFETSVVAHHDSGPSALPLRPAFALIGDLVAAYPQLASVPSVAIEIIGSHPIVSPPAYERRFYAMASITNNTTQEITIVTPR